MTFVCRMGDPALTRAGVTFDRARGPPDKTQMRATKPLKYAAKNPPLTCSTKCAKSEKLRHIRGHSNISWRFFLPILDPPPPLTLGWHFGQTPPPLTVSLPQKFSKRPLRKKISKRKAFETPLERKFGCKTQKWTLNHLISSLLPPFLVNKLLFQSLFTLFFTFLLQNSRAKCQLTL